MKRKNADEKKTNLYLALGFQMLLEYERYERRMKKLMKKYHKLLELDK